jgi:hypothetical protein
MAFGYQNIVNLLEDQMGVKKISFFTDANTLLTAHFKHGRKKDALC